MKSKYVLQEHILQIGTLFSGRPIYFPLRLDQRGRIYCLSSYLNYQANDLSKSLLLFYNPGYLYKHNHDGINFFLKYMEQILSVNQNCHTKKKN